MWELQTRSSRVLDSTGLKKKFAHKQTPLLQIHCPRLKCIKMLFFNVVVPLTVQLWFVFSDGEKVLVLVVTCGPSWKIVGYFCSCDPDDIVQDHFLIFSQ